MTLSLLREPYPSRDLPEPMLLRRREPVVWGQGPGPDWLPPGALARYARDGFLLLPGLLGPDEVALLQQEMTALLARYAGSASETVIREPGSDAVRSVFALPAVSDVFARLARHPCLLGFAQQVLGSEVYLHQSRLNYKPGLAGKEFWWHSDFETWHVEDGMPRMRAVSCVVLLTENNEFNGPLMLVPGSHMHYISCVGQTPQDHYRQSLRKQEYGVPDPTSLGFLIERGGLQSTRGPAGSVVFFDCNAMHGSNSNISPFPRANLFCVYNSVENPLQAPQRGLRPRPEFIAAREDTVMPGRIAS